MADLTASDKTWISAQLKALVTPVPFATGGGQHSPVGDAVLNGSFPPAPGKDRDYVWRNLQAILTAAGKDDADEAAIVSGVLAGLDPAAIAAAIPTELAGQVADILAERLKA